MTRVISVEMTIISNDMIVNEKIEKFLNTIARALDADDFHICVQDFLTEEENVDETTEKIDT